MVSDVLFEAVSGIDRYLNEPVFDNSYQGEFRRELVEIRNKMDAMRARLDDPADGNKKMMIDWLAKNIKPEAKDEIILSAYHAAKEAERVLAVSNPVLQNAD